ncbi:hypothetical protein D3C76_136160 [compost metagenome]
MFFAQKDMGFKYVNHVVDGTTITITLQSLTERMTVTFYADQCITLLAHLNETVERFNRRDNKPTE